MSLDAILLQKLAEWKPPAGGERGALAATDPAAGWTATVTADRNDGLSTLVWELTVRRPRDQAPSGGDALRAWADRSASRVTGLMEPLKVIEVDVLKNAAILRSDEPASRADKVFYYEVFLKGCHEAAVRRYQVAREPGQPREQVAFPLTHEALAKLARDLTAEK